MPNEQRDPEISHAAHGHYWRDSNLAALGYDECIRAGAWKRTMWEIFDVDADVVVASGVMKMRNGGPDFKGFHHRPESCMCGHGARVATNSDGNPTFDGVHVNIKRDIPGGQEWHMHCPRCAEHATVDNCCDPD
jgi:hypothetical protein